MLFGAPYIVTGQSEQLTPEEFILKSRLNQHEIKTACLKSFPFDCFDTKEQDSYFEQFDAHIYNTVKHSFIKELLRNREEFNYTTFIEQETKKELNEMTDFNCAEWQAFILDLEKDPFEHYNHQHGNRAAGDACTNPGFETCDFTNWELFTGSVTGIAPFSISNINPTNNYATVNTGGYNLPGLDQHAITSGGTDASSGYPMVLPGGSCSALIGDFDEGGSNASVLRQTFLVSSNDAVIILNYAAVLEDPNHSTNEQPYFRVRVYDQNGNVLSCGSYEAFAGDGQSGWQSSSGVSYLPWTTIFIPLNAFIGQNIEVEFTVGDCSLGGHSGYAYVDASCQPLSMDLTGLADCDFPVTLNAPPGAAGYSWTTGQTTQSIDVFSPGNYGVNVYPAAGPQCGVFLDTVVVDFNLPTADAGLDVSICQGSNTQLSGQGAGSIYSWDNGGTLSNPNISNPTASPSNTTTYTLTVENSAGCSETDDVTVTIIPYSDAGVVPQPNLCDNSPTVTFQAVETGGVWSGIGIVNSTTGEFDPSVAGIGSHIITYTLNTMCPDAQTSVIIVEPFLDPTITQVGPYCETDPNVILQAVDPGGVWSGTGIIDPIAGIFSPQLVGVGTYNVSYTTPGMCGGIDNIDIVVGGAVDATITPVGPQCSNGTSLYLQAATTGGVWSGSGIIDFVNGVFDPITAGPGLHTVTYTVTQLCTDIKTIDILVYPPLQSWISNDTIICSYGVANISTNASGGTGVYTYNWDNNLGVLTTYTVTPPTTTVYTVEINDGCETLLENVIVDLEYVPDPIFIADTLIGCVPLVVNLSNLSLPGSVSCIWTVDNGHIEDDCYGIETVLMNPGCYDVNLQLTTQIGCTANITYNDYICAEEWPIALYSIDPIIMTTMDTQADFTNNSINAIDYYWTFGDLTPSSTVFQPTHVFPTESSQNYLTQLIVHSAFGCPDTAQVLVHVLDELIFYVPNVFTPDGDQFNETWKPIFYSGHDPTDLTIFIFNRWGEILWESHNPDAAWNGHYGNGGLVQDGVYVWTIEFGDTNSDKRHQYEGHVVVLK
jgi:gliding motility-associated-like protein